MEEIENAEIAGKDLVILRLRDRQITMETKIEQASKLYNSRLSVWGEARLGDLQENISAGKDALKSIQKLRDPGTAYDRQKVKQMVTRQVQQLLEMNRLKKRKRTNQGP